MSATVLLVGNQNAGKTTLFNALTGLNGRVANFPGITVEARIGEITRFAGDKVRVVDVPGTYSLIPASDEEELSVGAIFGTIAELKDHRLMVVVIDSTEFRRGLYLYSQIIELGHRAIIALSMVDLRPQLDKKALQVFKKAVGTFVVPFCASDMASINNLKTTIDGVLSGSLQPQIKDQPLLFLGLSPSLQEKLGHCVVDQEYLPPHARNSVDLIKNYNIFLYALRRRGSLPVISQNIAKLDLSEEDSQELDSLISFIPEMRFKRVDALAKDFLNFKDYSRKNSDYLDKFLLQPVIGAIFLLALFVGLLQGLFLLAQPMSDFLSEALLSFAQKVGDLLPSNSLFKSLLVDGIFEGIGSVLTFLPLIALLFLFLAILEDSGYLARATFLLDSTLKRFGLGGRSLMPMLSGFACAVPAIMAARTIGDRKERFITIMVTPFLTCSARLPVFGLIVGALFSSYPPLFGLIDMGALIFLAMYALGLIASLLAAFIMSKLLKVSDGQKLAIELPVYRWPNPFSVFKRVLDRVGIFLSEVSGIILAATVIIWALFRFEPQNLSPAKKQQENLVRHEQAAPLPLENTYAGVIGKKIEPILSPMGLDWRIGVGVLASFLAREVFVSTMAVVYGLEEGQDMSLKQSFKKNITPLSGLSLLIFFTLSMQCVSTLAATRRETGSYIWPAVQFSFMTISAYVLAILSYGLGSLLGFA